MGIACVCEFTALDSSDSASRMDQTGAVCSYPTSTTAGWQMQEGKMQVQEGKEGTSVERGKGNLARKKEKEKNRKKTYRTQPKNWDAEVRRVVPNQAF
eukprot:358850-Chlamydomonas_euryale.AAC.3